MSATAVPHHLSLLIDELGPNSADVETVLKTADAAWLVRFKNEAVTQLTWHEQPARLEIATHVCRLGEAQGSCQMELMLNFNLLTHLNGGARMAISAPDRDVYLIRDQDIRDLPLQQLQDLLRSLVNTAQSWKTAFETGPASASGQAT